MSFVAQHILGGFAEKQVTAPVRDLILKHRVLGFTLFSRNFDSAEHLRSLNEELQALATQAGYTLLLAVDQEGGRVRRLPQPYTPVSAMRGYGERFLATNSADEVYQLGRLLGREVKDAGFNLNFAPVVDVDLNPQSPVIGDRSFSDDPEVVATLSAQIVRGLWDEGVQACLKHFPGHGATEADSHFELPVDRRSLDDIRKTDLIPYQKLIAQNLAPSVMTAHVLYPEIDPERPATLSKKIIHDILRGEMGYEGIIFSDDLRMKAIHDHHDLADASELFFNIGGDVVLICNEAELILDVVEKLQTRDLNLLQQRQRLCEFLSFCK